MMYFLVFLLVMPPFLIRFSRWLAIVQQKEYRFDRIWLFHNSREGLTELLKIFPTSKDFTRTGLKRPVATARIAMVALIFLAIVGFVLYISFNEGVNWLGLLKVFLGLYLLVPSLVMISLVPTVLVKFLATYLELIKASSKFSQKKPLIIGITGSYGKTTTKQILSQVLSQKFSIFVTPKSHNTSYSVAKSINDGYSNQEIAILEYAAYTKGEIKFLAKWFKPNLGVITGLTPQHLGLFGSLENIVKAKAELVKAVDENGQVFCNGHDVGAVKICKVGGASQTINYSGNDSVVKLEKAGLNDRGQLFFTWKNKKIQTKLIGLHYLAAIQAAVAVAEYLSLSKNQILAGLDNIKISESFINIFTTKKGATVIDDGKTSNPSGFQAALDLLAEISRDKKTILVTSGIVDLGSMSSQIHLTLAQKARKHVHKVFYTGVDGQKEFESVFGKDLERDKTQIKKFLEKADDNYIILLEGKIPGWVNSKW